MTDQTLHHAVATLQDHPAVDLAFALDAAGNLLTWAGSSPAFSPTGQFRPVAPGQEENNLYLVSITERRYLGVIFGDEDAVDEIQEVMKDWQNLLSPDS